MQQVYLPKEDVLELVQSHAAALLPLGERLVPVELCLPLSLPRNRRNEVIFSVNTSRLVGHSSRSRSSTEHRVLLGASVYITLHPDRCRGVSYPRLGMQTPGELQCVASVQRSKYIREKCAHLYTRIDEVFLYHICARRGA